MSNSDFSISWLIAHEPLAQSAIVELTSIDGVIGWQNYTGTGNINCIGVVTNAITEQDMSRLARPSVALDYTLPVRGLGPIRAGRSVTAAVGGYCEEQNSDPGEPRGKGRHLGYALNDLADGEEGSVTVTLSASSNPAGGGGGIGVVDVTGTPDSDSVQFQMSVDGTDTGTGYDMFSASQTLAGAMSAADKTAIDLSGLYQSNNSPTIADLDAATRNGWFKFTDASTGAPTTSNSPAAADWTFGLGMQFGYSANDAYQIVYNCSGAAAVKQGAEVFVRYRDNTTWGNWLDVTPELTQRSRTIVNGLDSKGYLHDVAGGDAVPQGWTNTFGGSVFLDPTLGDAGENIYRVADESTGDSSEVFFELDADDWDNIYNFGMTLRLNVRVPDESGDTGNDATNLWFGFNTASNPGYTLPDPSGQSHGWRVQALRNSSNENVLRFPDGTLGDVIVGSNAEYLDLLFLLSPMSDEATVILNGMPIGTTPIYSHGNPFIDNRMIIGSGSGSATDRIVYMRQCNCLINTEDNLITLGLDDFERETIHIVGPGVRDYTVEVPNVATPNSSQVDLFFQNTGTVTVTRQSGDVVSVIDLQDESEFPVAGGTKQIRMVQFTTGETEGQQYFTQVIANQEDIDRLDARIDELPNLEVDLGVTTTATNVVVTNTAGTDATIPPANDNTAGLITGVEHRRFPVATTVTTAQMQALPYDAVNERLTLTLTAAQLQGRGPSNIIYLDAIPSTTDGGDPVTDMVITPASNINAALLEFTVLCSDTVNTTVRYLVGGFGENGPTEIHLTQRGDFFTVRKGNNPSGNRWLVTGGRFTALSSPVGSMYYAQQSWYDNGSATVEAALTDIDSRPNQYWFHEVTNFVNPGDNIDLDMLGCPFTVGADEPAFLANQITVLVDGVPLRKQPAAPEVFFESPTVISMNIPLNADSSTLTIMGASAV